MPSEEKPWYLTDDDWELTLEAKRKATSTTSGSVKSLVDGSSKSALLKQAEEAGVDVSPSASKVEIAQALVDSGAASSSQTQGQEDAAAAQDPEVPTATATESRPTP
jgi:hypothetical protein